MKRKTLWLIALSMIMGVLIVSFLSFRAQNASARGITLKDLLFPVVPTPEPLTEAELQAVKTQQAEQASLPTPTVFPEGMENPPSASINWVIVNPEQVKKNEEILSVARELIKKAETNYLTAGWLYIASTTESFITPSQTFADGSPIPTKWQDESWTLLNEDGRAIQYIGIQDTGDEKTSQESVFKDGVWKNLSLDMETVSEEKSYIVPLDSQFIEFAERDIDIIELTYDVGEYQSEKVAVITRTGMHVTPRDVSGAGYFVMGRVVVYSFSLETGMLLKLEEYYITPDGEKVLSRQITTNVFEKIVEPPAEVLMLAK